MADNSKKALNLVRNLIRVGQVNSVNALKGTVDVLFEDRDNIIPKELPYLSFEYHMPKVGDQVLCLFLGNGIEQGFCLGAFFSEVNLPPVQDEMIFRKQLEEGTYIEYNKRTKHLHVNVEEVNIQVHNGKVTVKADEILLGDGETEGVPLGDQLKEWLDGHTHPTPNGATGVPTSSSPSPSQVVKIK